MRSSSSPTWTRCIVSGSEVVDIECREADRRASSLNAINMSARGAVIDDDAGAAGAIAFDAGAADRDPDLSTDRLPPARIRLRIVFTAHINKFGRGLYVVDYPTDSGHASG